MKLNSLIGCPRDVDGIFELFNSEITSFHGAPKKITGTLMGSSFCKMKGFYGLEYTDVEAIKFSGHIVNGKETIETINGLPPNLKNLEISGVKSISGIHNVCPNLEQIHIGSEESIELLPPLLLKNLKIFNVNDPFSNLRLLDAGRIVLKHLNGDRDVLECQEELISAGYKEFARL